MPIKHVIFILQENQTLDSMLGRYCVVNARCNGATTGLAGTTRIPLHPATDIVPVLVHSVAGQATAIDGGKMDGFYKIGNCKAPAYACYSTATDVEVHNLETLATNFAISDNTYSMAPEMSWEQHLRFGTFTADGFSGNNPIKDPTLSGGTGWGCTSPDQVQWGPSLQWVPPCIPDQNGAGPRKPSPVSWVPNIYIDDLAANGVSYKLYGAFMQQGTNDAIWCPACGLWSWRGNTAQYAATARHPQDILTDLQNGGLPQFSFVTPTPANSQHNSDSLTQGDNWIGSVVTAVEKSPYWASSAIVIGYDDCGCFYDHVAPPAGSGYGMRTPLVIVSPYARAGYTDSTQAALAPSLLALVEYVFGLPPLTATSPDNGAYHWQNAFNFAQVPLAPATMRTTPVPPSSQRFLASHPISQTADPDS